MSERLLDYTGKSVSRAGDVNGDETINIFDLVRVAFHYDDPASADPVADLNGSGAIDLGDLVLVAANAVSKQEFDAAVAAEKAALTDRRRHDAIPDGVLASVPVPTLVSHCSAFAYKRRNQRDTSNSMILVRLWI